MTPDTTQTRYLTRLRDAERAADNARRWQRSNLRLDMLAASGALKEIRRKTDWPQYWKCLPVVIVVGLVLLGAAVAGGW